MLTENPLHNLRDRALALRSLPMFAELDDDAIALVAEHARERRFKRGQTLIDGTRVDRLNIVLDGRVTVTRNGKTVAVVEHHGGVGVLAMFARDEASWRAVAEEDTLVLEVPEGPYFQALKESFPLLRNSLRLSAQAILKRRSNLPRHPAMATRSETGPLPERERTLVERMIELRVGGGPFATGNMDAVIELARRTTEIRVPAGHTFWNVGDRSSYSLRIIYGRVRCTSGAGTSVDVGVEFVLGVLDAWGGQAHSFSAVAETDVVAYRIDLEDFLEVLELHPDLALALLGNLARTLIQLREDTSPEEDVPAT